MNADRGLREVEALCCTSDIVFGEKNIKCYQQVEIQSLNIIQIYT